MWRLLGFWMTWAHKWLGLIVGVQIVLWVASGLFMTAVPIETVRGEHNVRKTAAKTVSAEGLTPLDRILTSAVTRAELLDLNGAPVWRLDEEGKPARLVDARTGITISPLTEGQARAIAEADFAGNGKVKTATMIEKDPHIEYRGALPAWRIQFDDAENTRLYVAAVTGKITARRTDTWRMYDFLWSLHIMDYGARENFNNPLVIAASALGLILSLTGLWIVGMRFWPPLERAIRRVLPTGAGKRGSR
jgi:uncharacterized iron-regulated membrane protein